MKTIQADESNEINDGELEAEMAQLEASKHADAIARLDEALAPTGVSVARLLCELVDAVNVSPCSPGLVETCGARRNPDGSVVRDAEGRPVPSEITSHQPCGDDEIDARNAALRALPAGRATALVAGLIARLAPALAPVSVAGSVLVKRAAQEIEHLGSDALQLNVKRIAAIRGRG